jgi:hypothetical protein
VGAVDAVEAADDSDPGAWAIGKVPEGGEEGRGIATHFIIGR